MRMVFGVVRSAKGVPGGILEKPVEKVCVNAASGGAASGKESEPFAMKRAVEMGAIIFVFGGGGKVVVVGMGSVGTRSAWLSAGGSMEVAMVGGGARGAVD